MKNEPWSSRRWTTTAGAVETASTLQAGEARSARRSQIEGCSQTYISTHAQHRERNIFASPGVHHRGEMPGSQSGHDYFEAKSGYGRWSKQLKNPVFRRFCLRGVSTPGVLGGCPPLLPVAICCMLLQVSEIRQQFCWIRGGPCRATYPRPVVLHLWNLSNFRKICQNSLHVH